MSSYRHKNNRRHRSKAITLKALRPIVSKARKTGKKIVFTNGCFDLLHVGHIRMLGQAKALGDLLIVGLNTDGSVKKLKGPHRPLVRDRERAEVLSALRSVDYVVLFHQKTPERLIRAVRPDRLAKGGDWKKSDIVGSSFVESYGGKTVSLGYVKGFSTTRFLKKIHEAARHSKDS